MLTVTGYLSAPNYGLRMDLHEGAPEAVELAQPYSFGQEDNDRLFVLDVDRYEHELPSKIGQAILQEEVPGTYEVIYDLGDEALQRLGRRGIMTTAMRVLLDRLPYFDIHATTIEFRIDPTNYRSLGLAKKLGAMAQKDDCATHRMLIEDYVRARRETRQHV